jgi:hypothetical protein
LSSRRLQHRGHPSREIKKARSVDLASPARLWRGAGVSADRVCHPKSFRGIPSERRFFWHRACALL